MRFLVAFLLCSLSATAATTYYVSPKGNDAASGTALTAAWKTGAKVSAAKLLPGDKVLFERGGEWREQLLPSSNGAAGNPITYDAYGAGNKPILWGSDLLVNANFTSAGGNSYSYKVNLPGGEIFVLQNHVFLGTGPAAYNNGTLTITSSTDPRTDGKVYTVCARGNEIYSNGKSHLVFRNITVDEGAGTMGEPNSQGYGIRIQNSEDVLVENCDALRCGRHNMAAINAHQVTFKGCHVAYVAPLTPADNGSSLYVSYADGSAPFPRCDSTYDTCTADHQDDGKGGNYDFYDSHGDRLGAVIFKNTVSRSKIYVGGGTSFSMFGGTLLDGRVEIWVPGVVIDGVTFKNNAFIDQWALGGTFQNCVFDNSSKQESGCILLRPNVKDTIIRFNTIVAQGGQCLAFYGAAPNTQWYGNIFQGTVTMNGNPAEMMNVDYNFYPANANICGKDFAAWQALGKDTHALSGDPKFIDAAKGNYALQPGSPCLGAAKVAANQIPPKEFGGTSRPAAPAMGALEKPVAAH